MFKHILAAVDGSSHAQRIVETAAWLANKVDAKLLSLCHVVKSGPIPAELTHMAEVEHLVPGSMTAGRYQVPSRSKSDWHSMHRRAQGLASSRASPIASPQTSQIP